MAKKTKRRVPKQAASNPSQSNAPNSPIGSVANPHGALRQVREATGMTQAEFADALEMSSPYIQAVELGQRKASPDLARRVQYRTGASPVCIEEDWEQAVDIFGEPYTTETYRRFRSSEEDPVTDAQIENFVEPLASLARAAAKKGKLAVLGTLVCDRLTEIKCRLHLEASLNRVLKKKNAPVARKITVGELRKNSAMATLLGYRDDPARPDDDVLTIQGMFEERSSAPPPWFPSLDWYPRAEEIQRRCEERHARQGGVSMPAGNLVDPAKKKTR